MSVELDPLLDGAPCGFACVADDGAIVAANRTLPEMLGLAPDALQGKHVDVILSAPSRVFFQTHVFPLLKLQGRVHEVYLTLRNGEGGETPVMLNAQRRARDGCFMSDWVVVPMRQRDAYENAILEARRDAEAAVRAKDEFLALVSHELRAPLRAISGWTQLLVGGRLDELARRRTAAAIDDNTAALSRVVEELLDYGRIVSGEAQLDLRPVMLDDVLVAALDRVRATAGAKRVELAFAPDGEPLAVSADEGRLRQVFWHILSNAVKFTPEGGRVEMRRRRHGGSVRVSVSDTGEGIAAATLPFVFDRLRLEPAKIPRDGALGLGMVVTRYLVELHGGTIAAASDGAGKGATFTVQMPLVPCEAIATAASRRSEVFPPETLRPPVLDGVDLLVVDGDATMRERLRTLLAGAGATVRAVASVEEALACYAQSRPAVLVSDLELPGTGDGLALVRRVREIEETSGACTPAIALTRRTREEDRLRALSAGFQLHLAKPMQAEEMLMAIAALRPVAGTSRSAAA